MMLDFLKPCLTDFCGFNLQDYQTVASLHVR